MKKLMKGNEALAEGAIRGGCRFYAGYPITPQTEILEYMSWRMDEVGGTFIQGESELASMGMLWGAAACGMRTLTSSSGPGFTLKQEGLAYMVGANIPAVLVCVGRFGQGGGSIAQGQDAYWQVVKGGGNGDYRLIVLAPNSVQENADMAYESFTLAEKYRLPVIILSDGAIGQMVEACQLPPMQEHDVDTYSWAVKGTKLGDRPRIIHSRYYLEGQTYVKEFTERMHQIRKSEQRWEAYMTDDADLIMVAYGISSRIAKRAVQLGRDQGINLGLIRPKTLWPFPRAAFQAQGRQVKAYMTVEISMLAQMKEDVAYACRHNYPVHSYTTACDISDPINVVRKARAVLEGKIEALEAL